MVKLATLEWAPPDGTGSDPPLAVLVHGVTGWSRTWWRIGPALAERGWRVVAVDQRGHGRSPRIEGHVGVAELAADLIAAIEAANGPADVLIGHSLGAAVSAEAADARPDLVRRLVLEDPPSIIRADDTAWLARLEGEYAAAAADPEAEVARELAEHPAWLEGDARQNVEGRSIGDAAGVLASMRRPTGARIVELAPHLRMPVLYILAAEERSAFTAEARQALAANLPSTSRVECLDAGHTVHRDRFEAYVDLLVEWLS